MSEFFSISDFFRDRNPEETYIFNEARNYTCSDTLREINAYANYISELYLTSGYAAVLSENRPELLFLTLALWDTGITPILINNKLSKQEINNLLKDSPAEIIFASDNTDTEGIEKSVSKFPARYEHYVERWYREIKREETAVVIYTSGSTGKAKGVELSFKTLLESGELQNIFLKQQRGDKWLLSLPFYHIGGFSIFLRSLINYLSLIIPETLKISEIYEAWRQYEPQYVSLVGTQLKKIIDDEFSPGKRLKNILIGGGFTDKSIIQEALARNLKISSVYGSTETASFIAAADSYILTKYPSAAGKEIIPESVLIIDGNYDIISDGAEGEIALSNIPLMTGYLNDPESSSKKFGHGLFLTGDIGYKNSEGVLFLSMRRTDLIVSGGENINPKEIEKVILGIPGITDVYVFAEPDIKWGQIAAAAVCGEEKLTGEAIKKLLSGSLARFKIPKKFYFIDIIPRNELGKIQSEQLKQKLKKKL